MKRHLAALVLSLAILTPASLAVSAGTVLADNCNTPVAQINQNGSYTLVSTGSIYCGWTGVGSMYVDVVLQRCTVDVWGCRSWEWYHDWGWEGKQGYGQLTKSHSQSSVMGQTRYRTYAMFHIYKTDGSLLLDTWALSNEYWVS